jgi:hypothetical protein
MSEWDAWAAKHATTFGLIDQRDGAMLREWVRLFAAEGYAPAELAEATAWLATHNPPEFRSQHLARLTERLRGLRAASARKADRNPDPEVAGPSCPDCGDLGAVSVPHLKNRPGGPWYEACVACSCRKGELLWHARREAVPGWLTLAHYEMFNPMWRDQAEGRRQSLLRRGNANIRAGELDKLLGRIMGRLRNGLAR